MAKGVKTAGRRAVTPNRSTAEAKQTLEALDCDPLEGMARTNMAESQPTTLRANMYRELAQYVAPKRKALEHKGRCWLCATSFRNKHRLNAEVKTAANVTAIIHRAKNIKTGVPPRLLIAA